MATTPYPFVASTVLTALQLNSTFNIPTTTKTASHTFIAADAGTRVIMNAAGSTSLTLNTSIFAASDVIELQNIGAGVATVTAGTATVSSAGPLAIPQHGGGRLVFSSASAATYFPSAITVSSSALTLVGSATLSSTSTKITSVFSATYDNYLMIISDLKLSSSAGYIAFNLLSGSTSEITNYVGFFINYKNGVNGGDTDPTSTQWDQPIYQNSANSSVAGQFYVLQPFLATTTIFNTSNQIQGNFGRTFNGVNTNATSYDGIEVTNASGFASGKVRIYGYALT